MDGNSANQLENELSGLYRDHAGELFRYATSLTRNPDTARDAVQETFLRYFVERRYGRQIEKPRAWLNLVLRNYVSRSGGAVPAASEIEWDRIEGNEEDPEASARRSQMAKVIGDTLSRRERECLNLRAAGMGYAEIASSLGIQPGTVGALLARVYAKVRGVAGKHDTPQCDAVDALCLLL